MDGYSQGVILYGLVGGVLSLGALWQLLSLRRTQANIRRLEDRLAEERAREAAARAHPAE